MLRSGRTGKGCRVLLGRSSPPEQGMLHLGWTSQQPWHLLSLDLVTPTAKACLHDASVELQQLLDLFLLAFCQFQ